MNENPYQSPESVDTPRAPHAAKTPKSGSWGLAIVLSIYAIAIVIGYLLLRPLIVLIHSFI